VFLDIDLGGGNGFDLVPHIAPAARIIFVTAHNDYAVRAFEVNALDYLLKPVSAARLAASLTRVAAATVAAVATSSAAPVETPPAAGDSERLLGSLAAGDRVFLKNDRGARFVPLADLAAIISCDNYTDVFVADGSHFLVRRSLKAWESALPSEIFVRVHRQALINLSQLERIDDPDGDTPTLRLHGVKQPVACSHRLTPDLRRRLVK
jgi:two-component system LytT family response regulator